MENVLSILNKLSSLIALIGAVNLAKVEADLAAVGVDLSGSLAAIEKSGADLEVLLNDLHASLANVKSLADEQAAKEAEANQPNEPKE